MRQFFFSYSKVREVLFHGKQDVKKIFIDIVTVNLTQNSLKRKHLFFHPKLLIRYFFDKIRNKIFLKHENYWYYLTSIRNSLSLIYAGLIFSLIILTALFLNSCLKVLLIAILVMNQLTVPMKMYQSPVVDLPSSVCNVKL